MSEPIITVMELDEAEEKIIKAMFEFFNDREFLISPGCILDCNRQEFFDLRGRFRG